MRIFPGFSLVLQAYKNHLKAIGPRLEEKTLHMRASFLELMTILWLKWLTCSTGSVLLLLNSEGWLSKLTRELCVLNVTRRWWSRYLAQGPTHGISPHIPQRRCSIPPMKASFSPYRDRGLPMNIALQASSSPSMTPFISWAGVWTLRWASMLPRMHPLTKPLS